MHFFNSTESKRDESEVPWEIWWTVIQRDGRVTAALTADGQTGVGREWFRCLPETIAAEIKQTSASHSWFTKCLCVVVYVCVTMLFSLLTTSMWTTCGVSDSSPGGSAAIVATHTSVKLTAYTTWSELTAVAVCCLLNEDAWWPLINSHCIPGRIVAKQIK